MHKGYKAFTLVELIVVLTIVSILSTIGFVAYVDYLKGVRDTNRLQQMSEIYRSMELYATRTKLPFPDDDINIVAGTTNIGYQGYAGESVLEAVRFSDGGTDPKTKQYYSYMMSADRKSAQILWYFETQESQELMSWNSQVFADYSTLFPQVVWIWLGILVDTTTKIPVQEDTTFTFSGKLDILSLNSSLKSYISNETILTGTGVSLIWIVPNIDCAKIKNIFSGLRNGIYKINPIGWTPTNVYCNMEIDGGGWTLVARSVAGANIGDFGWLVSNGDVYDDSLIYSFWPSVKNIYFNELMLSDYTNGKQIDHALKIPVDSSFIRTPWNYNSAVLINKCTEIYPLTAWMSACDSDGQDGKVGSRNFTRYWGFFDTSSGLNNIHYFFRHSNNLYTSQGLMIDGYDGTVQPAEAGSLWDFAWKQGMIFVR